MRISVRSLSGAALAFALIATCNAAAQSAPQAGAPPIPTAQDFARRPAVSHVAISPDGKHMAAILSPDGEANFVQVWATDAPGDHPWRMGIPPNDPGARFTSVAFVKNDRIAVTYRDFEFRSNPVSDDQYSQPSFTIFVTPSDTKPNPTYPYAGYESDEIDGPIVNRLPHDPRDVVMLWGDYPVLVDVQTGRAFTEAFVASSWGAEVDPFAAGRVRCGLGGGGANKIARVCQARTAMGQPWKSLLAWQAAYREPVVYVGGTESPNVFLLRAHAADGRALIVPFDITTQKALPVVFAPPFFDADRPVMSNRAQDPGRVVGYTVDADEHRVHWTDPAFATAEQKARASLKVHVAALDWTDPETGATTSIDMVDDFDVRIVDYSDDFSRVVIEKVGPRQPPEYYLLTGDTLALIGKSHPGIDPSALGHSRLTEFTARDGLVIPVIVTTPAEATWGKGPYPAIVVPHDGPWSRDHLEWDSTGRVQYFAAHGYLVLQPQFRGSTGFGAKLWRAGDREWGLKIQDDIDDSAKWAAAQGLADPTRVAIHGYSFGGYQAFVAATRSNGVFRCAISGEGFDVVHSVSTWDAGSFDYYNREVFVGGVSPIDHIDSVAIPVMAYHGAADHRVSVSDSRRFTNRLKEAHRPYQYIEFPQMGHRIQRWTPADKVDVLNATDSFLKTDCGMAR